MSKGSQGLTPASKCCLPPCSRPQHTAYTQKGLMHKQADMSQAPKHDPGKSAPCSNVRRHSRSESLGDCPAHANKHETHKFICRVLISAPFCPPEHDSSSSSSSAHTGAKNPSNCRPRPQADSHDLGPGMDVCIAAREAAAQAFRQIPAAREGKQGTGVGRFRNQHARPAIAAYLTASTP